MKKILLVADGVNIIQTVRIVEALNNEAAFGGVKIGFGLALRYGLKRVANELRIYTGQPLIYDHQKAGNDIPDVWTDFAEIMSDAGMFAAIGFPFAGPITETSFIEAMAAAGVAPIIGGHMTHEAFAAPDGYVNQDDSDRIYRMAASRGVTHFVVPGTNPEAISRYRSIVETFRPNVTFYSPGLITQGGDITAAGEACGENFVAVVGRALTQAADPLAAFREMAQKLT